MRSLIVGLLVVSSGCFLRHRNDDEGTDDPGPTDDPPVLDGGTTDGPIGTDAGVPTWGDGCPYVGIYPGCDDLCDGTSDCPGAESDYWCNLTYDICVPQERFEDPREQGCHFNFGGSNLHGKTCADPDSVCTFDRSSPSWEAVQSRDGYAGSGCSHISLCFASEELQPQLECVYSDLTPVVTGPPEQACPEQPSEDFPFCGTDCGSCSWEPDRMPYLGCVGLNDERGVGVCALDFGCRANDFSLDPANWEGLDFIREPLACLLLRDPETGEWWEGGWLTAEASCKAYRELYPDRYDCRNYDWESIP